MASKQSNDSRIRFPIEQKEQAAQREHSTLLARDIYDSLAKLLEESLDNLPKNDDLDQHRSHSAILIDGKRGTGKSSVLVNLSLYLDDHKNDRLANEIHVLKPVDPTLLEDSDDLFLNVIVAAIIRDKAVAAALSKATPKSEEFHHQLQLLGSTLEALQSQRNKYGLDKLRAFMGSHDLNQQVHDLFKKALDLIDKKLLVLPIDDVDTSLNRAFDNLEVVRRYLTSPYVQPIISGDLGLYHEVTWRNFYSKLTKDSKSGDRETRKTANDLATDYQRKIMPLHLRMEMPTASSYLENPRIFLAKHEDVYFPLPVFSRWLDALLNDRLNNLPGRRLNYEVETVRELAQLVFAFRKEIPALSKALDSAGVSLNSDWCLHRLIFMPTGVLSALEDFPREYQHAQSLRGRSQRETARDHAYNKFFTEADSKTNNKPDNWNERIIESKKILLNYMHHKHAHAATCLALEADLHFIEIGKNPNRHLSELFSTRLFEPLKLSKESIATFPGKSTSPLPDDWKGRAPEEWLKLISEEPVPYALPEIGRASGSFEQSDKASQFIIHLMQYRSYFSESRQTETIFSGRIFELVISSLVRDISPKDILILLNRVPFHSLPGTLGNHENYVEGTFDEFDQESSYGLSGFSEKINAWRRDYHIDQQFLSSWLTFNVMNNYFAKTLTFNPPLRANQNHGNPNIASILLTARSAFRTLWNAFARVEKGEIFGMPLVLTSFNVGANDNFEQNLAYKQNIQPLLRAADKRSFGQETRSYTFALAHHPLFDLIELLIKGHQINPENNEDQDIDGSPNPRLIATTIKKHFNISGKIEDTLKNAHPSSTDIEEIENKCIQLGFSIYTIRSNQYFDALAKKAGTSES